MNATEERQKRLDARAAARPSDFVPDLEEYRKTEIIRKAVADVKKRAAREEYIRKSPEKVYAHVKSRIAGNMKSQKKAKKVGKKI